MFARRLIIIVTALTLAFSATAYAGKRQDSKADSRVLSVQEAEDLVFMREEEKLARDVYAELYRYHKEEGTELLIFANIAASEQRHMDAMLVLLDKYGITDPAAYTLPGEFENQVLADLYANLVSDTKKKEKELVLNEPARGGAVSVPDALTVGAWIEERDMIDILHAISHTSRADIVGVYTELLCGSRSHLRAFVGRIGEDSYRPQILYSSADTASDVEPRETLEYWLGDESDEICM